MGLSDWFGRKSDSPAPAPAPKAAPKANPVKTGRHAAGTGLTNNSPTRHARTFRAKHSQD